ncbi:ER membrane protein complex subunit 6 [Anoplophora glabripennis]|uniref:ER membrane protein complex subunit 6 n=1 Tax=Anoplophora glabripennis TaxID=217634 RepID=UPI0008748748|nr:ER membrane protein complex subunit 6 [Anoplophora glabripennis]
MSNKAKNEPVVAYSELAIRNNLSIVEYCRTSVAAVSGCTAGVLGLTGGYGALFFILAVTSFWLMLLCKAGIDSWKKFFTSRKSLLVNGIFGHFFTYILCWTFIYGMVHVY